MAAPPNFSDISKAANDLLNRDFYHASAASLEVKSKAPNGVSFNVKGKSDQKQGAISGSLEGKYSDKSSGATITQTWTTANSLDTKIELDGAFANGIKAEILTNYLPATQAKGAKLNLHFKQPNLHGRCFVDMLKGPKFNADLTFGQQGALIGGEVGYDVQNGQITRYAAGIGYSVPEYTASVIGSNNMTTFAASYYHKVNSQVEAGAKAVWDSKGTAPGVALELGSKYKIAPDTFAKAKINNAGIAAFSYNQVLRPGVTLGLGMAVDTQRLNESAHKMGVSFTFEG